MAFVNLESYGNAFELDNFLATLPVKKRVEDLVAKAGGRVEVELVSSSTGGFVVSFGSLLEFLPYRNLIARWKFLAFQSWLRIKGLDPSKYKLNLGVVGYNGITNTTSLDSSLSPGIDQIVGIDISPDMKLEDLPRIYDQEKLKFLLPFVGQRPPFWLSSSVIPILFLKPPLFLDDVTVGVSHRKAFTEIQQRLSPRCRGGWELDESIEEAALRETLEEAGVIGKVEVNLPLFIEFWFF
ncbi:hypothetical protein U1Q18_046639 [Sarracenia purpurea var. burkii]